MGEVNNSCGEIAFGDEMVPVTRDNMTLYRHLGANAVYDHCFIESPDGNTGAYIWRFNPNFEPFAAWAEANQARLILNIKRASEFDRENYVKHATEDLTDTSYVPEQWLEA